MLMKIKETLLKITIDKQTKKSTKIGQYSLCWDLHNHRAFSIFASSTIAPYLPKHQYEEKIE